MYSSKKRKTAIAVLLLVVLCYIFSTITQATNLTAYNIAFMRMYGSNSPDTSNPQWRNQPYTIIDENNIVTGDVVYAQTRQLIEYTFTQVYVTSLEIDFDISVELYSTGELLNINQSGTPKIELYTPYKSINITYNKLDNYHLHYHYDSTEINRNVEKIDIYTNVNIISSKMYISNINIKINNEIYIAINEYTQSFNNLKEMEENLYNIFDNNGLSSLPTRLQNMANHYSQMKTDMQLNGYFVDKSYFDNIFNQSTIFIAMMNITMLISVCSYMLFGKLR